MGNMNVKSSGDNGGTYDAIVIGSGISGGYAAMELCQKGYKTLVLERGRMVKHGEYPTANRMAKTTLADFSRRLVTTASGNPKRIKNKGENDHVIFRQYSVTRWMGSINKLSKCSISSLSSLRVMLLGFLWTLIFLSDMSSVIK